MTRRLAEWLRAPRGETLISLVLLLKKPQPLTTQDVRLAVQRAFHTAKLRSTGWEVKSTSLPTHILVTSPKLALGVMSMPEPYVKNRAEVADGTREFLLKKAIQDHDAWIGVDALNEMTPEQWPLAYQPIGRLIAELADDNCIAIYCPQVQQMNSYAPDLLPILRGDKPLEALSAPRNDPSVPISEEDAELVEATAEAKARWPEFVAAFNVRRPEQGFAVKIAFEDGEAVEHMWVEVSKIDHLVVFGKLANEPNLVRNAKLADPVQVNFEDIEDWIYADGARMVGGFSREIVQRRATRR
jgi:uncharacterized protein YegJ (DUF2314 family)